MLRYVVVVGSIAGLGAVCVASAHTIDKPIILEGTIVTPDTVIRNGKVVVDKGRIVSVGTDVAIPAESIKIRANGIIYPGLIDLHDHVSWNFLPRWNPPEFYDNRYEWRGSAIYLGSYAQWSEQLKPQVCERNKYGELKALLGGVTAIEGVAHGYSCVIGLLRSLNYYSGYSEGNEYPRFYDVLDITYLTPDRAKVIQKKIASGEITCLILHLAEGRRGDGESQYEFTVLQNYGLLTNKTALIHAAALNRASIQLMAQNGASLVWSPRSNLTLYGQTADIRAAVKDGVLIALAPDWSITGSDNVLDELKVARLFFDDDTNDNGLNRDLVRMVTSNPAAIAGLSGEIGSLKPGYAADLVAVRGDAARPYGSLIDASVQNVELVMIDGQPYYGSPEIMRMLGQGTDSETINVCGEPKLLHLRDSNPPPGGLEVTLTELTRRLTAAIGQLPSPRPSLAPMFSCR